MKPIKLPVAELKPALTGLGKVHPGRTTLAILNQIKVERTHDGWIALTCTDLDRWITLRLEHPDEGPPTTMLLPFEQLSQIVKSCGKSECIEVAASADHNLIRFPLGDTLGESKVPKLSPDEFPPTPRFKCDAIPLSSSLRESLLEAMDCASEDSTRLVLNGTLIDAQDSKANYVVATDGRHLYSANSFTLPLKESVIIPTHKFLEWKEFTTDGEWQMRVGTEHLQLSSRRWRFITRQIEGKYPDWRVTIPNPKDAKTHITLDPAKLEALSKLIQRIPCHDPDRFETIGLEWKQGQFLLLGKDKHNEPWTRVPIADAKGTGPDITIFISRHFLIKALSYGLNTISLIEYLAPLRFHNQGKQMIVMPLRPGDQDTTPRPSPPPAVPTTTTSKPPPMPPAPQPPTIPKPMINNPTSEGPPPNGPKTTIEECIDLSLAIRDKFNDGFNMLRDLGLKLKLANREQKMNAREMHSVRSTLRSLQGLKI